jgi:hypothetical protein
MVTGSEYILLQGRNTIAKKRMKRHCTSLVIREILIKTVTKFYFTPIRMIISKRQIIQVLVRSGEIGAVLHSWWECQMVQPLWKIV